ncbi:MAG: hypothetical protein IPJ20_05375 [Flammeovirgaceae bacterium]|nr:hypothetical protein [Flammeovirgaceae bacterium]
MIQQIMTSADTLSLFRARKSSTNRIPNNTYFMSYHLYQARQDNFSRELDVEFNGNLKGYIKYLSEKYPFL